MSTNGVVAIKSLRDVQDSSPAWHRANRELEAMLRVKGHPYVVTVEEIFLGPEGPCLVMEYLPGGSIADRLAAGPLTAPELVLIGQHVSEALIAAHDVGIVHRDIKPANLMVGAFGQVKVGDFGISALVRGDDQTKTSSLTLAYASPEELDGEQRVGPPTDVYSLAATMHHLVTGIRPTFSSRIHGWAPLDDVDPALAPVAEVITTGLSDAAGDRPTMRDVAAAFDAAAANLGPRAIKRLDQLPAAGEPTVRRDPASSPPSSNGETARSGGDAKKWLVPVLGGLAAVAVVLGIVLAIGGDDESPPGTATGEAGSVLTSDGASSPTTSAASAPDDTAGDGPSTPLAGDGVLRLSGMFPLTGDLETVAAAARRGFELAATDVNAAGGVLGEPVVIDVVDASTDGAAGIDANVDVVVGPLSNETAEQAVPAARDAGRLTITPAVTEDSVAGPLFARLVASNSAQGRAIASLLAERGVSTVGVVGLAESSAQSIMQALADSGLELVVEETYDSAEGAAALAAELIDSEPEAVVIAGFEEDTAALIDAIVATAGSVPFPLYGTDANTGGDLADLVADPASIAGMTGVFPAAPVDEEFAARLNEAGALDDPTYAAETYDAVVMAALATLADDSDAPTSIADQLIDVSRGGTPCNDYATCAGLLDEGADIDYQGRSGDVDLTDDFERERAPVIVFRYDEAAEFVFEPVIEPG